MGLDADVTFLRREQSGLWTEVKHKFDAGRAYGLFAILFGVRNEWGYKPVVNWSQAEDLPGPWTANLRDCDGRSKVTLDKVLGYDYSQKIDKEGYLPLALYRDWKKDESPGGYWQEVSPRDANLSMEEADRLLIEQPELADHEWPHNMFDGGAHYVHIRWTEAYLEVIEYFLNECRKVIEETGEQPENLAVVFTWYA